MNKIFSKLYKPFKDKPLRGLVFFIWLCWLVSQLFFINADPDLNLSDNRDAYLEEGLCTAQVRNYVNHAQFHTDESDCLMRSPLFGAYLLGVFSIFGAKLAVARLSVLLAVSFILLWIGLKVRFAHTIMFFMLTGLLQYHIFQYSHFCMAEILCTACALLAIMHLGRFAEVFSRPALLWATCWLALAALLKFQFSYMLGLVPAAILITVLYNERFRSYAYFKKPLTIAFIILVCWLNLVWWGWYVPYRSAMSYMTENHMSSRFVSWTGLRDTCWYNIKTYFLGRYTWPLTALFVIAFRSGLFMMAKERNKTYSVGFWLSTAWVMLEAHKLGMVNLSPSHLISFWAAMSLLNSWVLAFGIHLLINRRLAGTYKIALWTVLLPMSLLLVSNLSRVRYLFLNRSYEMEVVNAYMDAHIKQGDVVLGAWSTALCWSPKAYIVNVKKNYFNDKDVLAHYHPAVVVSEEAEEESGLLFASQGIDLREKSDSVYHLKLKHWNIGIYWMKK